MQGSVNSTHRMKIKAVTLSLLVVLATSAVWVGGAMGTQPNTSNDLQPAASTPIEHNSTGGVEYVKGEPSQKSLDKPINFDSAPDRFTTTDSVHAGTLSTLADRDSSIIMDPSDDATDPDEIGTTKQYLGSDNDSYYFKNFTLLSVGDHVEVWVAQDMTWPENDSRTDPTVTEQQAEALRTEFDDNIYGTEADVFGKPNARNGTDGLLEQERCRPRRLLPHRERVRKDRPIGGQHPGRELLQLVVPHLHGRVLLATDSAVHRPQRRYARRSGVAGSQRDERRSRRPKGRSHTSTNTSFTTTSTVTRRRG